MFESLLVELGCRLATLFFAHFLYETAYLTHGISLGGKGIVIMEGIHCLNPALTRVVPKEHPQTPDCNRTYSLSPPSPLHHGFSRVCVVVASPSSPHRVGETDTLRPSHASRMTSIDLVARVDVMTIVDKKIDTCAWTPNNVFSKP